MRDREVVESIKAGDPAGLAEAYGSYAASLYAYCASMLREPADAADAVQDTFLIAASGLRGLRDPDRLRPWLYTVARNVCLRKLRNDKLAARYAPALGTPADPSGAGPSSRGVSQVSDPTALADPARVGDRAERAELRAFVRDAADGLTSRDREILRLRLWHELSLEDTAVALGLSRGHASALYSRARAQLETCLGVLLVARSGRLDCERLDAMLTDWDGQLTVLLRKRLSRHIEQCGICGQRRRRELVPAFIGGLSPWGAVLGAAATEAARHSAQLPAGLGSRILDAAAHGTLGKAVAAGAGAGAAHPQAAHALRTVRNWAPRTKQGQATAATAATAAAAAAAVAIVLALHGTGHGQLAGGGNVLPSGAASIPATPGGGAGPGGANQPGHGRGHRPGASPGASAPGHGGTATGAPGGSSGGASLTSHSGGSLAGNGNPAPGGGAPQPTTGSSSSAPPPSSGQPTPPPPASSPPPSSPPPPPAAGTLSVSAGIVLLAAPLLNSAITLTAHGGTVTWSIAQQSSLLGGVTISPMSGTLAAGQSARVAISANGLAGVLSTLVIHPGERPVQVIVSVGL